MSDTIELRGNFQDGISARLSTKTSPEPQEPGTATATPYDHLIGKRVEVTVDGSRRIGTLKEASNETKAVLETENGETVTGYIKQPEPAPKGTPPAWEGTVVRVGDKFYIRRGEDSAHAWENVSGFPDGPDNRACAVDSQLIAETDWQLYMPVPDKPAIVADENGDIWLRCYDGNYTHTGCNVTDSGDVAQEDLEEGWVAITRLDGSPL